MKTLIQVSLLVLFLGCSGGGDDDNFVDPRPQRMAIVGLSFTDPGAEWWRETGGVRAEFEDAVDCPCGFAALDLPLAVHVESGSVADCVTVTVASPTSGPEVEASVEQGGVVYSTPVQLCGDILDFVVEVGL